MKSNPLRIIECLDRHLSQSFTLYVYGRSALALGFANSPAEYHATMDVDAILPSRDVQAIEQNEDFWRAQEQVNRELGDTGLYFTHLFEDRQVVLTPDWLSKVRPISGLSLRTLQLWRPSTADLILSKMMRVDPQDRDDITFLARQPDVSSEEIRRAIDIARVPGVREIEEAFLANRDWVLRNVLNNN